MKRFRPYVLASSNQRLMKSFLISSLALLLAMSSLGHLFAAALCPRASGRECCLAKTSSHKHDSSSSRDNTPRHCTHGKSMAMSMGHMLVANGSIDHRTTNGAEIAAAIFDGFIPAFRRASIQAAGGNEFDQPVESCAYCLGRARIVIGLVSFAGVPDKSGRDRGYALSRVPNLHNRFAIALAQIGLPKEHAPPCMSAPLRIFISVFLI